MAIATRTIFLTLTRSGGCTASRALSSIVTAASDAGATASPAAGSSTSRVSDLDELRSQIFRLKFPKRSAANLLQEWVAEGNPVTLPELRRLAKDLNRAQRYKHALEALQIKKN